MLTGFLPESRRHGRWWSPLEADPFFIKQRSTAARETACCTDVLKDIAFSSIASMTQTLHAGPDWYILPQFLRIPFWHNQTPPAGLQRLQLLEKQLDELLQTQCKSSPCGTRRECLGSMLNSSSPTDMPQPISEGDLRVISVGTIRPFFFFLVRC